MTDQEALNGFVELHPWEWQEWDIASYHKGGTSCICIFAVWQYHINSGYIVSSLVGSIPITEWRLVAGPWIEGRLREMMGKHFYALLRRSEGEVFIVEYHLFDGSGLRKVEANTPIQALLAALEAIREA